MLREALPEIVTGSVPGAKAKAILDRRNEAAPDIIATAKSMGAGVPISDISAREEVMDAAPAGTIGGTYWALLHSPLGSTCNKWQYMA